MKLMATKSLTFSIDENEDVCLTCHEKAKLDNSFVYLACVTKDKSSPSSYYAN